MSKSSSVVIHRGRKSAPVHGLFPLVLLGAGALGLLSCGPSGESLGDVGDPCATHDDCLPGLVCGPDGLCAEPSADGEGDAGDDGGDEPAVCVDEDYDLSFPPTETCPEGDDCDDSDSTTYVGADEICGDGSDNDCDGEIDEAPCSCKRGDQRPCYTGPDATADQGICRPGVQLCGSDGEYGDCLGETVPEAAQELECDGRDEDCDGEVDEGLADGCGGCGDVASTELCDSIDNDCDGEVDEGCGCDPDCLCETDDCLCRPPTDQPCYDGPANTMGFGECHGGVHDCVELGDGWSWSVCEGQQLPEVECAGGEADGVDNDCDGAVDEDCLPDGDGDGFGPNEDCDDSDSAINPGAVEVCNDRDDDCDGVVDDGVRNGCGSCEPITAEVCNGLDDNCNGEVDEVCPCNLWSSQECYTGPAATIGVGVCHRGIQECVGEPEFADWGPCDGEVTPGVEICDGEDNDCDGEVDERWAAGSNPCGYCVFVEECDGEDDDCDGLVDEGLRNSCGDCLPVAEETLCDGEDNDCDGLVDEGLVNSCGRCPPDPCYVDSWGTEEGRSWEVGVGVGASTDPDNPLHEDCERPDTVCLDSMAGPLGHIWISNTVDDELVRMNVETGEVELEFPSRGRAPSRTAVDTRDSSVWVANRAYGSDPTLDPFDGEQSNVVHFSVDGELICRVPLPGLARGLAIDAEHNLWVGLWENEEVVRIEDGYCPSTSAQIDALPRQHIGCHPYGAAADRYGNVWFACNEDWLPSFNADMQSLVQVDMTDITNYRRYVPTTDIGCYNLYGIAVDRWGRVWIGSHGCHGVFMFDPWGLWRFLDTGEESTPQGVAVAADGTVWAADAALDRVLRIESDLSSYTPINIGPTANYPVGAALDLAGRIWVVNRFSDNATRVDVSGWPSYTVEHFDTHGEDPYTYSDMTGLQHLMHTSPEGTWTINFDSGYAEALWAVVEWVALEPQGTDVSIRARTAATEAGLDEATWSSSYTTSPADIASDTLMANPGRWIQVQVTLSTEDSETTPVLYELHVRWEH